MHHVRLDHLAKSESRELSPKAGAGPAGAGPAGAGPEGQSQLKETPLGNEPQAPNKSTAKAEALNKEGSM